MSNLSYIVETNGENGVRLEYHILDYVPLDVVWDGTNTFPDGADLPDVEDADSPEYVRRMEGSEYAYYRRVVFMPSKSATFSLYILSDNTPVEYSYDAYSSFLELFRQGDALLVVSRTNVSGDDLNGVISVVSNLSGETLTVPVFQEYDPIRMRLLTYVYENMDGDGNGIINDVTFEHTFHWLTQKTSPDKETLEVEVWASGPRNGFIIRDVSEYAYVGELDESYVYSTTSNSYYQTVQTCDGGNLLMVSEDVIFDTQCQGVFKKVRYNNNLKVVRLGNSVKITNYGRCFLQDDAYYVVTLANVDGLKETASIIIRYASDEP